MKLRTDFVSNSSSSSFIIKNVESALDVFNTDFKDKYLGYRFADSIKFTVVCKERDAKELEAYFANAKYEYQPYATWDFEHKYKISLDDEHIIYDVYSDRVIGCDDKDVLSKVIRVSVSTSEDNDEVGKLMLKLLYKYFSKRGVEVDASQTEVEFLGNDDFITKLVDLV